MNEPRVLVPGRQFQPSEMFAVKQEAYPCGAPTLTSKHYTRTEGNNALAYFFHLWGVKNKNVS